MQNEQNKAEILQNMGDETSQNKDQNNTQNTPLFDGYLDPSDREMLEATDAESLKGKTPLRIKYEAEKSVIIKRIGELEDIRLNLGLSKRKICQLLMVDPSAWTRWVKKPESVPPHIYRSLEWYVNLQGKNPNMGHSFWLSYTRFVEEQKSDEVPEKQQLDKALLKEELLKELNQRLDSNMMWVKTDLQKHNKKTHWKELSFVLAGVLLGILIQKII